MPLNPFQSLRGDADPSAGEAPPCGPVQKSRIERGHLAGSYPLDWVRCRSAAPAGILLAPPLIGGKPAQQLQAFRWLVRKGFDILSFSYSGHGGSHGKFSLDATLRNTDRMLRHAAGLSRREGLPLSGIASCYGALPLLRSAHRQEEPLQKLVLINAIPGLNLAPVLKSFRAYYQAQGGSLRKGREIFGRYLDLLFPNVEKNRSRFGVLRRERANLAHTAFEFFTLDPLKGVALTRTPVLSLYSSMDTILEILSYGRGVNYESEILKVCPKARFLRLPGDHFLSAPDARNIARSHIEGFLTTP